MKVALLVEVDVHPVWDLITEHAEPEQAAREIAEKVREALNSCHVHGFQHPVVVSVAAQP